MNGESRSVLGSTDHDNCNPKHYPLQQQKTCFKIDFRTFGRVTVSLPLGGLIFCFVTAIIFQFEEVNKTVCNVPNLVPSISAITGVTPQRYIWRVCIALHSTPRFAIGFIYWQYYMERLHTIDISQHTLYRFLVTLTFWVYTVENACLVGVTYIANVENYPVHEKIFVVFMVTSLLYELLTLVLFRWVHPDMASIPHIALSYKLKRICFILIAAFTAGLLYFFFRHRWYCEPGAFTMFSTCEYGIAIVNILFHFTATNEFHDLAWHLAAPLTTPNNNHGHQKLH